MTHAPGDEPSVPPRPVPPVGPPAGWYPDAAGGQRWWDGYRWTEHQLPGPQQPPPPAPPAAGFNTRLYSSQADQAAGTNTAAIWSLVTGILGIVLVLLAWWLGAVGGIAALIWGSVGMGRSRRYGVGYGMSIAGLVLGAVTVIFVILRIGTFGV